MTRLPTHAQALELFTKYKVPSNIKEHCLKVNQVANFLARKLREAGVNINLELVDRGSLLHDLFKAAVIKDISPTKFHSNAFSEEELAMREELRNKFPNMFENEIAYEIFKEECPQLALTILNEGNPKIKEKNQEESLIYYADMRVFREDVVNINQRFSYFRGKYPAKEGFWDQEFQYSQEQQNKIFQHLNFKPEDLKQELEKGSKMTKTYPEPTVGTFILNDQNEILLIKSPKWNNRYTVAGGHIEIGETIEEAVKREVKEELGIDVDFIKVFNTQENIFDSDFHEKRHFIFLDCLCKAKTFDVKLDGKEAVGYAWFKMEDVLSLPNVRETTIIPIKEKLIKMVDNG